MANEAARSSSTEEAPRDCRAGDGLGGRRFTLPSHVVFRSFPNETVVLNLQTGKYHGLNPTAGRMLEVVTGGATIDAAAAAVAREYDRPPEEAAADLRTLCRALLDRGLVEYGGD